MSSEREQHLKATISVLVVEDEPMLQEIIGPPLEDAGFAVLFASDGDDALGMLEEDGSSVRALVTDIDLGRQTTGWDVARRAREIRPDIAVVYMTGGRADEWPANGVPKSILITKPFAPAQVVTAVSQLLNTTGPPAT
jgi:DNA-binding response OmpR family regulator